MTDPELVAKKLGLIEDYAEVDLDVVEDVLRNRLDTLLAFVAAMRGRLP